jgi:hypothetical protein
MLYRFQLSAEELERRFPYIKLAISAYRMIRRTVNLTTGRRHLAGR